MGRTATIANVPDADLNRVKTEFEAEGATVVVTPNVDNTSKVVATYPSRTYTILNVPQDQVERVKQEFVAEGATVIVSPNEVNTFTVLGAYQD
jgi:hypothetical protein